MALWKRSVASYSKISLLKNASHKGCRARFPWFYPSWNWPNGKLHIESEYASPLFEWRLRNEDHRSAKIEPSKKPPKLGLVRNLPLPEQPHKNCLSANQKWAAPALQAMAHIPKALSTALRIVSEIFFQTGSFLKQLIDLAENKKAGGLLLDAARFVAKYRSWKTPTIPFGGAQITLEVSMRSRVDWWCQGQTQGAWKTELIQA